MHKMHQMPQGSDSPHAEPRQGRLTDGV